MTRLGRSVGRLLVGSGFLFSLSRCGSDTPPAAKATCSLDSECNNPLVCRFTSCHNACNETRDCPNKTDRCIKAGRVGVCQTLDERHEGCTYSSECPEGLKCAVDQVCRVPCLATDDCLPKQVCTSHVCADPDELDQRTHDLPHTNPVGGWNGTTDDGGIGGGPEGGMKPPPGKTPDSGMKPPPTTPDGGHTTPPTPDGSTGDGGEPEAGPGGGSTDAGSGPSCGGSGFVSFKPSNLPASLQPPAGTLADLTYNSNQCFFVTDDKDPRDSSINGPHWDTGFCNSDVRAATKQDVLRLSDGREVAVVFMSSLSVTAGSVLQVTGQRPVIFVVSGDITINGTVSAKASVENGWYAGGAPGPTTAARNGICALDTVDGGGRKSSGVTGIAPTGAMGAGGGGFCGKGGSGSPDMTGTMKPAGGVSYGDASLVPLVGGSGGGSGDTEDPFAHGGGAIQIAAGGTITISETGIIDMGGGGGRARGVGGGSGGAILLEAPNVVVRGVLAANGGGGGAYWGRGTDGQPSAEPAPGGNTMNGAAPLGTGGAADSPDGANVTTTAQPAGGGGGAGRIRINTGCGGKLTVSSSAVISPSDVSGCYATGTMQK